jgi:hypothetical protein
MIENCPVFQGGGSRTECGSIPSRRDGADLPEGDREISRWRGQARQGRPTPPGRMPPGLFSVFSPAPVEGARTGHRESARIVFPAPPPGREWNKTRDRRYDDPIFRWRRPALRAWPCHRLSSFSPSGRSPASLQDARAPGVSWFRRFTDSPIHQFTAASCGRGRPRSGFLCASAPLRTLRELLISITSTSEHVPKYTTEHRNEAIPSVSVSKSESTLESIPIPIPIPTPRRTVAISE